MATTITATPEPDNLPPRVLLEVVWTGGTEVEVTRTDSDGQTFPVRGADPATITADEWSGYDYESWFGADTVYEATDGVTTATSATVSLDVDDAVWLRHPASPGLSTAVNWQGDGEPIRRINRAVFDPLSRRYPIVVTDGRRKAPQGVMTFRTWTWAERDTLYAICDDGAVLLLDIPPGYDWPITHAYVSLGDLTETPTVGAAHWVSYRDISAPYDVVDRPGDTIAGPRTWINELLDHATWAELLAAHDTWTDVVNNT